MVFRDWLPSVIQEITPFVSSEDIDKGDRWNIVIAKELENSAFGILCVTKENISAPWLMFEAGALSKTVGKSSVSPFLFDIQRSEVDEPILQFQSTIFEKNDIKKLVKTLNEACGKNSLSEERLMKAFDVWYPTLEANLNAVKSQDVSAIGSSISASPVFQSLNGSFTADLSPPKSETLRDDCIKSGIQAIFPSREEDGKAFHEEVYRSAVKSKETSTKVDLLGIALQFLFDTKAEINVRIKEPLASPNIELKILLLDYTSESADQRDKIEQEETKTLQNIKNAILRGIPALVHQRICERIENSKNDSFKDQVKSAKKVGGAAFNNLNLNNLDFSNLDLKNPVLDKLAKELKLQVRLYDHDPTMLLMRFNDSLFVEQYHFGNPDSDGYAHCIGKRVPVLQFTNTAKAYRYLSAHFDFVWNKSKTKDVTNLVVQRGLLKCRQIGCAICDPVGYIQQTSG